MAYTAYSVATGNTPSALATDVARLITAGYQMYGQAFLDSDGVLVQPMAKGTLDVNNNTSAAASVLDGATLAIKNSAGADSHNATATVASNAITAIKFAATVAMVDDGDAYVIPVTGVYATTATVHVAAGVPTSIVLS